MNESYIDVNDKIIRNRAKFYKRNGKGLENTPEVNNSYKIAGGGILSTSTDLLKFGNAVLNSFNGSIDDKHALLTKETATNLFSNQTAKMDNFYCLGFVNYPFNGKYSGEQSFKRSGYWYHTGAGSGACSILLIKPDENGNKENDLVVALLVNLQDCSGSLTNLALEIAEIFNSA
uniref:Beta-lactamase domain-containing protein n=1 Tax=Rhabditophanes sp. KR3021 TaxID=114890 RepID=A0AC35UGE9_9BILA